MIGQVIKQCRKDKGISQLVFASLLSMSQTNLSRIENELIHLPFRKYHLICRKLNITKQDLLLLTIDKSNLSTLDKKLIKQIIIIT
jgi:transcriptional regulator with XRE-family HTH domain